MAYVAGFRQTQGIQDVYNLQFKRYRPKRKSGYYSTSVRPGVLCALEHLKSKFYFVHLLVFVNF